MPDNCTFFNDDERLDIVNDSLKLIQNKNYFKFGTDALLLAGFTGNRRRKLGCELGSGSGIVSLLLAYRGKFEQITAIEIQKYFASLTERNAVINGLTERIGVINASVNAVNANTLGHEVDAVYSNPPYMKTTSGKQNQFEENFICRHEKEGTIDDFAACAARLLKYGGSFFTVYRPDRLTDLICALRNNNLEPKRITFVAADKNTEPSLVLTEAKLGSAEGGLKLTAPFLIYDDSPQNGKRKYSHQMEYLLENGVMEEK